MCDFEIGDKVSCMPETMGCSYLGADRKMHSDTTRTGTICYVHPQGRFVTVAIETLSGIVKESFQPWEVQKMAKKRRR